MSENDIVKKKTDAEWLADLFTEGMTDKEKYDKLSDLLFIARNSGYCDSMAGELASGNPSKQAIWWEEVCEHQFAIERECKRLKERLECYEGETDEEGQPHGKGTKYYFDGRRYEGEWSHGVREGFGIEYAEDGRKFYEGNWKHDKHYGNGVLIDICGIRYEGFFEINAPYGEAKLSLEKHSVITYPGGEIVEGPIEGKRYLCTYPNGDILECEHFSTPNRGSLRPCPEGDGVYRFVDGGVLCGYWNGYGQKQYRFSYTAPDGTKTIRYYENDKLVSEKTSEE